MARRHRVALLVLLLVGVLGAVGVGAVLLRDGDAPSTSGNGADVQLEGSAPERLAPAERDSVRDVPTRPPARVCGSPELDGPATPPPGFVRVPTTENLDLLVNRSAAGTRFWLAPGLHHLGPGRYDQVAPKDGMVFTGAPGAVLDGRRLNRYAFTGEATDVVIEHLTIQNFGQGIDDNPDEGVVNHDTGARWVVRHNTVRRNAGAGVFIGDDNVVADNCLVRNGQYGFSAYEDDGVRNVVLRGNEVAWNNTARHDRRNEFCGCTGGGKFWETSGARITGNWIHDNLGGPGLWADTNNVGFLVSRNWFTDNDGEAIIYEISYNAEISNNAFLRNGLVTGPQLDGFPTPAIYLSEAGSDTRAGQRYGDALRVVGNRFVDNWGGVVGWENADRFAGSPNNTSTGTTTLVNPDVATEQRCGDPDVVGTEPYVDDCRWKTQHLRVAGNTFSFDPSRMGSRCTVENNCGFSGLFSQIGSSPEWSPYNGDVVEQQITFEQDNRWSDNTYAGPWRFMVEELGNQVSWDTWRGSTYGQDEGSTLR